MFFLCILDSIDNYLMEYNSVEPYMILIFEGLFGSIYTCIKRSNNYFFICAFYDFMLLVL